VREKKSSIPTEYLMLLAATVLLSAEVIPLVRAMNIADVETGLDMTMIDMIEAIMISSPITRSLILLS